MEEAPKTIDRYVVEALLGEGGMGRVYRALDPRLGRRVAVKVLLAEGTNEQARKDASARMVREARAAAAFNHPNVVAVYDVGEVDGNPFIAMELVTGGTMRACFADPAVTQPHKLAWLLEIARGLGAAHRAGLVHRDVKPDNVMITTDGVVKILDFGIAKSTTEVQAVDPTAPTSGANLATLTARGVAIGTPQYMSPEQLHSEPLDGRTDQFSWGVMCWEMLAGALPWGSKSGAQLITQVLAGAARPLAEVVPGINPRVSDAVARALEKKREQRFGAMEELVLAIEGEVAFPPSPGSSARFPVVNVHPHDTGPAFTQPTNGTKAPSRRSSVGRVARIALALGAAAIAAVGAWLALHRGTESRSGLAAARPAVDGSAPAATPRVPAEVEPYFTRAAADEREGRHDRACDEYLRAAEAFPASPAAALAATMCYRNDAPRGRAYFRRAWGLRSGLSPVEVTVLDAYEPFFQRDPSDFLEEKKRLEAAVARFPDDPDLHFYLAGAYRLDSLDVKRAVGEIERSLALNPNQPHVLSIEADFHGYDADFPAAHESIERCLRLAPGTLDCLEEEEWLDGEDGECAKVESEARRMLAIEPGFGEGVHALANALYARGGSVETVRELLHRPRGADAGPGDSRADDLKLAIIAGEFSSAEKIARSLADDARSSAVAADHGIPARALAAIERESGRDTEAAAAARGYLDGRDAWEPNPDFDDWAMADEPSPAMLAALRRVGAITRSAYDAEIAKTVERWKGRATPSTRNFIWIYAYAVPAESREDAERALVERAKFEPVPKYKPLSLADAAIGNVYFLAGRTEEAIAILERATRSCFPLDHPIEHTRAHYVLGLAREAKGDVEGACAAYAVVRDRWGKAKPRSVTAQSAMARRTALKCKP